MASNIFVAITTEKGKVEGESKVTKFTGQIEAESWSWGVSQSGNAHTGTGASTGTTHVQDVTFTAALDKTFPVITQACASGLHLKTVVLTVCKTSGEQLVPVMTLTLSEGIISSVSVGGAANSGAGNVSVGINFGKFAIDYKPQDKTGAGAASVTATYDVAGQEIKA